MILAEVSGKLVASAKSEHLTGRTLLLCRPIRRLDNPSEADGPHDHTVVAVDLVGAAEGSIVIISTGSSARAAAGDAPAVDMAAVGLVDYAVLDGERVQLEG